MKTGALLAALLLVTLAGAGCLGGESRSEWAYDVTQIDVLAGQGKTGVGVRIGVLDTGINLEHSAFKHLRDGVTVNGELVGFQDFLRGRGGPEEAYDDSGHGSHVVGIMAAQGSTFGDKILYGGIDLRGGSPASQYYVAKVCDDDGCPAQAIQDALEWMGQVNVDIVSLSLGGERGGVIVISDAMREQIDRLINSGTIIVASAGNDGATSSDVNAPADIPGVIAVGAIDDRLRVAELSSRGDNGGFNQCRTIPIGQQVGRCDPDKKPEVVAPGINILSTWTGDGYARASGTSQAAPFVTSALALMLQGKPKPTDRNGVDCVKQILMDTATPLEGQTLPHDEGAGYGLIQAADAAAAYPCR